MTVDEMIQLKLVHEIHTSGRKSFRACRRRWDWIFRNNYYPVLTAKPLEFGTAYHYAMEVYWNPETWHWDNEVKANMAIVAFAEKCKQQLEEALIATEQVMLDEEVREDYEERVELGKGMLWYYFTKVAPVEDIGFKPVKVEIGFMVTVKNPETGEDVIWCKCDECAQKYDSYIVKMGELRADTKSLARNLVRKPGEFIASTMEHAWSTRDLAGWGAEWSGLPVVYAGRIDMLAEDRDGRYWIYDWKTAGQLSDRTEFLDLDDQIGAYVWALRKIGISVRGFIYHEQRKAFPEPPAKNVNIRLGRKYSVSRSQATSYAIYLETVAAEDTEAWRNGLYDDFLNWLKEDGPKFYARYEVLKSADQCDSIEYNIGLEILDMLDPKVRIYPSAGKFGCSFCAFRQPCIEKDAKGDYQYFLDTVFEKREHYYVRTEASTESKGAE